MRYRDMNYELDNDSTNMPATANQSDDKTSYWSAYGTDPVANTILLPESDNCYIDMPVILIMVVLISL